MFRFCGTKIPTPFVSLHSKMEIMFHSDFTKSGHGFLAHYEFLGEHWHPFQPSTVGCGPGYLTGHSGLITSPGYNHNYPDGSSCTWIIKVKKDNKVLVHLLDMDLKQAETIKGKCSESYLLIFDGFATPEMVPNFQECGQLKALPTNRREYLATTDRVVIRFESGEKNKLNNIGFQISWTAIQLTLSGSCKEFECAGSQPCLENPDQLCNRDDTHYCIHSSLKCNEVPNCGAADTSDEEKCLILLTIAYIAAPIAGVLLVGILIVYCYCRCCRRDKVIYSMAASQEPPPPPPALSTPHSSHFALRSLERSPSITRSSCIMYSTSFTDCSSGDQHAGDNNVTTPQLHTQEADHLSNVPSVIQNPNTLSAAESENGDDQKPDYQTHRKRPSYHMMRELCYEDGNIVIADI
ncbi:hypothetical protein ACJMK2_028465 [Sinanodonta woodiana]|uniref:CUB domain-containing protein n=1 Tax=Sinanodonta woodiana TaxID=1069815 RepID=A0ABD3X777_SINWO